MQIIPASKSEAVLNIADTLADILGWSDDPDPQPLSDAWFESYCDLINGVCESANRSFADDKAIRQKIQNTRKLAVQFLGLMFRHPELSTVVMKQWPVCHQTQVAALTSRRLEFMAMGEPVMTAPAPSTVKNEWVRRREELGESVEDQMIVLYKKDSRTSQLRSPEIAAILGCSDQIVRKRDNKVWKMFRAEKETNMKRLSGRHSSGNQDDIDDE